jgi:hypothetical protein
MKTTVELPDDLLHAAKLVAAKRRISLKRLFSQALRREISDEAGEVDPGFALSDDGMPYLPKRGFKVRSEDVYRLDAESEG